MNSMIKDYFGILELPPSASTAEIKKAYRRLAQQFHPDKTGNDPYAAAQFAAIKEAYETLTHPSKKDKYLQQRWYEQSTGSRRKEKVITPDSLLRQALELEKYVSRLDHFRMDKMGLFQYINEILSNDNIEILNHFNDRSTNRQIIAILLTCMKPLSFTSVELLITSVKKINGDPSIADQVDAFARQKDLHDRKDRFSVFWMLAITLLICLLIFLISR